MDLDLFRLNRYRIYANVNVEQTKNDQIVITSLEILIKEMSDGDGDIAANRPGYRQLFDVYQTPTLSLLDKNKRIIAKKLTYQQFDEVITLKLKNENKNWYEKP